MLWLCRKLNGQIIHIEIAANETNPTEIWRIIYDAVVKHYQAMEKQPRQLQEILEGKCFIRIMQSGKVAADNANEPIGPTTIPLRNCFPPNGNCHAPFILLKATDNNFSPTDYNKNAGWLASNAYQSSEMAKRVKRKRCQYALLWALQETPAATQDQFASVLHTFLSNTCRQNTIRHTIARFFNPEHAAPIAAAATAQPAVDEQNPPLEAAQPAADEQNPSPEPAQPAVDEQNPPPEPAGPRLSAASCRLLIGFGSLGGASLVGLGWGIAAGMGLAIASSPVFPVALAILLVVAVASLLYAIHNKCGKGATNQAINLQALYPSQPEPSRANPSSASH